MYTLEELNDMSGTQLDEVVAEVIGKELFIYKSVYGYYRDNLGTVTRYQPTSQSKEGCKQLLDLIKRFKLSPEHYEGNLWYCVGEDSRYNYVSSAITEYSRAVCQTVILINQK